MKPPTTTADQLRATNFQINNQRRNIQSNEAIPAIKDIPRVGTTRPACILPQKVRSFPNRIRTGHGNCADFR